MLDKIYKYLKAYLFKKHFVFRFQYYFETTVVNDTNVIEYEFINVGSCSAFVNDMELLPATATLNIFNRKKFEIKENEEDTTIYRIKFLGVCMGQINMFFVTGNFWVQASTCDYSFQIKVGGNPVTNPIIINTGMNSATIENLLRASFIDFGFPPPVNVIWRDSAPFTASITRLNVPCSFGPIVTFAVINVTGNPPCNNVLIPPPFAKTYDVLNFIDNPKLAVVSKVKAGLKDNP